MSAKKLLVIGAHSADFVWRSAGSIAVTVANGGSASVVALSYGERGESGDLWRDNPEQTVENVKRIRHEMAEEAADHVGASFRCLDLGDYPLHISNDNLAELVQIILAESPDVILTHAARDPFNPDHPIAHTAVQRARLLAAGAGVASAFQRITPPAWYAFEPHQPELCGFQPNTFIDITPVMDKKIKALNVMKVQSYLIDYYTELAARRGNHAMRVSGDRAIKYAEAHERQLPWVVSEL